MTIEEKLAQMGVITGMGLLVVFAALIILWLAIEIMHKVIAPKETKETKALEQPKDEPVQAPIQPAVETFAAADDDEEELVAVIMAAIAASMNTPAYNLKIKSFRRISKPTSAWAAKSRQNIYEII